RPCSPEQDRFRLELLPVGSKRLLSSFSFFYLPRLARKRRQETFRPNRKEFKSETVLFRGTRSWEINSLIFLFDTKFSCGMSLLFGQSKEIQSLSLSSLRQTRSPKLIFKCMPTAFLKEQSFTNLCKKWLDIYTRELSSFATTS